MTTRSWIHHNVSLGVLRFLLEGNRAYTQDASKCISTVMWKKNNWKQSCTHSFKGSLLLVVQYVILSKNILKYEGTIWPMPNITGHINTWVSPYEKKKKHIHVLNFWEQKKCWLWHWEETTYVSFFISSQKRKPESKTYTEIPHWEDGKREGIKQQKKY